MYEAALSHLKCKCVINYTVENKNDHEENEEKCQTIVELFSPEFSGCSKDCKCNDCDSRQKILLNRPGNTVRRTCKLTTWVMYQFYTNIESSRIMMNI